jgi:hypothetical protein
MQCLRLLKRPFGMASRSFASSPKPAVDITLWGHYVSQPARACAWLLKMQQVDFVFKKVEPMKGDCKTEEYLGLFPTGLSPGLQIQYQDEDKHNFHLTEGSAIMQYLCELHGWTQWWPAAAGSTDSPAVIEERAVLCSYLSSHHSTTRNISKVAFFRLMRSIMGLGTFDEDAARAECLKQVCIRLCLSRSPSLSQLFLLTNPLPFSALCRPHTSSECGSYHTQVKKK